MLWSSLKCEVQSWLQFLCSLLLGAVVLLLVGVLQCLGRDGWFSGLRCSVAEGFLLLVLGLVL
jgi:hypothetical protein